MTTTLITGANKGLGYETARRLIAAGQTVFIGARDRSAGERAASGLGARFVELDVSDTASVASAVSVVGDLLDGAPLDVLINNAGIIGEHTEPAAISADIALETFNTNAVGVIRVTNAFLPLLRGSVAPTVVNVTSGLGSLTIMSDSSRWEAALPSLVYSATKAAVTMLTVKYAQALPNIRFNAVDPGYTSTDFNGNRGTQTVEEGTDEIVRLALAGPLEPSGTVTDRMGVVPW